MEYEIRFYFSKDEYNNIVNKLKDISILEYNGRKYEKTSQFNHPDHRYDFYKKEIDGRFRIRLTKSEDASVCKISWKRRLNVNNEIFNSEEEKELTIKYEEYDNLMFIIKNVINMEEVESYERYRTTFINNEVEIALDEYPFGLALEIESKGDKPNYIIKKYLKLLNLNYENSYKLSWDDKYEELCKEQNKEIFKHVTFDKDMPSIK